MRKLLILLLATTHAFAATVTVCASGCTTTSLQTAMDTTADCGDTIEIKSTEVQTGNFTFTNRGCTLAVDPITVTSDRAAWLPADGTRITLSDVDNMAIISSGTSDPALKAALDGSNVGPKGWVFDGIWFRCTVQCYYNVGLNFYAAQNSTELASGLMFKHSRFGNALPTSATVGVIHNIGLDCYDCTVRDSYFDVAFDRFGAEGHSIYIRTSPGPVYIYNNTLQVGGIGIFSGGTVPTYAAYLESGVFAAYNYSIRPLKLNSDPTQPHPEWYEDTFGSYANTGLPATAITALSDTGVVTSTLAASLGDVGTNSAYIVTITGVGGCTEANASGWRVNILSSTTYQLQDFPGCAVSYTTGGTGQGFGLIVCTKNLGELKWAGQADWQYNVAENGWSWKGCFSQGPVGLTGTLRTTWESSYSTGLGMGTISLSDSTHATWTGDYRILSGILNTSSGTDAYVANAQDFSGNDKTISYTTGVGMSFHPISTSCTGPATIAVVVRGGTNLGAKSLFAIDGVSDPGCTAGSYYRIIYDASLASGAGGWRMPTGPESYSLNSENAANDMGLCVYLTDIGIQCSPITAIDGLGTTATLGTPLTSTSLVNTYWQSVFTTSASLKDVTFKHNVFRNSNQTQSLIAQQFGTAQGTVSQGINLDYSDNLTTLTDAYFYGTYGFTISAGQYQYWNDTNPSNVHIDHNTLYGARTSPWVFINSAAVAGHENPFELSSISNNLFGPTNSNGNKFGGDSHTQLCGTAGAYLLTSDIRNNVIPGGTVGTGDCGTGNTVSGNIVSAWSDPYGNGPSVGVYKVLPGTTYSGGATDGTDIGVNFDLLPTITSLQVNAQATHAILSFNLAGPIRDAGSTQPCTLEVSTSINLHSTVNTYSVINALNPTYITRVNSSTYAGSIVAPAVVANGTVTWPIGLNATSNGDDGISHSWALTPSTLYYGLVSCYGDTQQFTFTTTAADNPATAFTLDSGVTAGTTDVAVNYGATSALGSSVAGSVAAGRFTASVPLSSGNLTYYQIVMTGGTAYTSPMYVR